MDDSQGVNRVDLRSVAERYQSRKTKRGEKNRRGEGTGKRAAVVTLPRQDAGPDKYLSWAGVCRAPAGALQPAESGEAQASSAPVATLPNHSSMEIRPPAFAALPWSLPGRSSWIMSMRFQPASGVSHAARGT